MKTNNNRRYDIYLGKNHTEIGEYSLGLYSTFRNGKDAESGALNLTETDVANIAKAVATLNSSRICFCPAVRRKYLTGIHYDGKQTECEFYDPDGYFRIKVEAKRDHAIYGVSFNRLYEITFSYRGAFGEDECFIFVLREQDFIALGMAACDALAPDEKPIANPNAVIPD